MVVGVGYLTGVKYDIISREDPELPGRQMHPPLVHGIIEFSYVKVHGSQGNDPLPPSSNRIKFKTCSTLAPM
jgi:hypothetical protein